MKKLLYVIPVLCALIVTGCKGNEDSKSGITAIEVKPAQTTLAEGSDITLTVIPTPKGAKGEYTWASSDTTVAIVDAEGKVTGITAGTAYVTVTEKGGATAKSEIKVTSYLEAFTFGQACFYTFSMKDTTGAPIGKVESSSGTTFNCYFVPMEFWVFSEGFYLNEDEGMPDGAEEGLWITMPTHVYYGPAELNPGTNGALFCLGPWQILKDSSNYYDRVGEPGEYKDSVLVNVLKAIDALNANSQEYANYLEAAGNAVSGTSMNAWYYYVPENDPENGYYTTSYVADAILEDAFFYVENETGSSSWMNKLSYISFTFRPLKNNYEEFWWGVEATLDEENEVLVIKDRSKLHVGDPITMEFGTKPSEEVAKRDEFIRLPESMYIPEETAAKIKSQLRQGHMPRNFKELIRK